MFKKIFFILFILVVTSAVAPQVKAQCSMCTISAEQGVKDGNTQTKGLNAGVIYLLAIPFIMVAGVGVIWYVNFRKKPIATTAGN